MKEDEHVLRAHSGLTFVLVVACAYAAIAASGVLGDVQLGTRLLANVATGALALALAWPLARRRLRLRLERDAGRATLRVGARACTFSEAEVRSVDLYVDLASTQIFVIGDDGPLCRIEEVLGCTQSEGDKLISWAAESFAPLPVRRAKRRLS